MNIEQVTQEPRIQKVKFGTFYEPLAEVPVVGPEEHDMKLASRTESHRLAVVCEMPQSDASPERLSNCPFRPAQSLTNLPNVSMSPMFKTLCTSRST